MCSKSKSRKDKVNMSITKNKYKYLSEAIKSVVDMHHPLAQFIDLEDHEVWDAAKLISHVTTIEDDGWVPDGQYEYYFVRPDGKAYWLC